MRTRTALALAGAVLAGLLAACAGAGAGCGRGRPPPAPTTPAPSAPAPSAPAPSAPAPSAPAPAPTTPAPGPPESSPPARGETTLTGQVIAGVEAGCRLLDTGAEQYLLTGEPADELAVGGTVTVRGRERPDLLSTCQQGIPFEVTEVVR
jgi:hypothetical protein